MDIDKWLRQATHRLSSNDIQTARLDSLVLLEDQLKKDRTWILANTDQKMSSDDIKNLDTLLSRRVKHEPLAYIRHRIEFYGRDFYVDNRVLVPRPESENMIELLKKLPHDKALTSLADVGTGSGALGITAAVELPVLSVDLIDISKDALEIAKINVDLFTLNLNIIESDLLSTPTTPYDILLCNLPYVPDSHDINRAATHEPKIALFSGPDGLDMYRKLFNQLGNSTYKPLYILTEALPLQHHAIRLMALKADYEQLQSDDFIQVFALSK